MKNIPVSNVRNIVVLGHTHSGKTTLIEALIHKLGINDRLGSVVNGTSMSDYTDEEKARNITIFATPFSAEYKTRAGKNINFFFTDTPGYMDFFGQVLSSARAADVAVIVVDASSGVQVGTRRAWKVCARVGLSAKAFVITGLDKENTDYAATLEDIKSNFGKDCVPVTLPMPDGSGVVDILASKDVPDDMSDQVGEIKNSLVELAAETDDALIEKFFAGEDLSPEEISAGLDKSVASGSLVPVFACMPLKDKGITEFLEGAARLLPPPDEHIIKDIEDEEIKTGPNDPFVGFVWRSVNDPFVGQMSFVRVIGGTLSGDSEVYNSTRDQKERVGSILLVNGKKQSPIDKATAGDIIAIPKLKITEVNDTLCSIGSKVKCNTINFPSPVMFQAVTAKTRADEDKIGIAIARVCGEDPTLQIDKNAETHEMVLQGLGDVHIDVAVGLMKSRSNVEVLLSTPKVPYRETITSEGEGRYKHKKQSGGRGQYGEVYLRVFPKKDEEDEWFVNNIVGGTIPSNFIPAVQKGLVEGMNSGAVAGYPVQGVKVSVYDGSYHDVDSSEVAFKIAGARALKEAMANAKPVLLEPIMKVKVTIPDDCMGDINGDLNHKRGRILGMGSEGDLQVITAEVPQSELFRYSAELRSMTGGRGGFSMEFSRYDVVPANITQKVVAGVEQDKESE